MTRNTFFHCAVGLITIGLSIGNAFATPEGQKSEEYFTSWRIRFNPNMAFAAYTYVRRHALPFPPLAFVPGSGITTPVELTDDCAKITLKDAEESWQGSYVIDDREVYTGDVIRLELSLAPEQHDDQLSFNLLFYPGMPLLYGGARNVAMTKVKTDTGNIIYEYSVPEEFNKFYLCDLVINFKSTVANSTLKFYSMELLRLNIDNRVDADKILATPPVHDTKVAMYNGVPTILIDGKPTTGLGYVTMIDQQNVRHKNVGNYENLMGKTGFPVARSCISLGENIVIRWNPSTWIGPNRYDFSSVDEKARRLLKINPEMKIIFLIVADGARWWTLKHPESGGMLHRGGIPDYLSEAWQNDAREAFRQMLAHIQSSDYGHAVIGYEFFAGKTMDCNYEVNDETPAAIARFRDFLKKKYGTEVALRKAWKNETVTFATAKPTYLVESEDRIKNWEGPLLLEDPETRCDFLDSKQFREEAFQNIILDFAKWIKEATHGRVIVGARTGDFMGNQWNLSKKSGAVEHELNPIYLLASSPYFDFFDVQYPYFGRDDLSGETTGIEILPVKGLALKNKLVMIQDDMPHLLPAPRAKDEFFMLHSKRLVFITSLISGTYPYQWEMGHFTYNLPYLIEEYHRQEKIYQKALQVDRSSVAEVAIVWDEDYQRYVGVDPNYDSPATTVPLLDYPKWTWQRAGAPVDVIFLDQLDKAKPYKVYIFNNTFNITPEKLALIKKTVCDKGNVAIFSWADGFFDGKKRSIENMNKLTGINLNVSMTQRIWEMEPADWFKKEMPPSPLYPFGFVTRPGKTPLFWEKASHWKIAPSFTIEDSDAKVIGYYKDNQDVAIALKKFENWTSIYSASSVLSPSLLRYAFKLAGVHEFISEENGCFMNRSFAGIQAVRDGEITMTFPEEEVLYNVYTGEEYPKGKEIIVKVEKDQTYLFFRGSEKEWDDLVK